MSLTCLSLGGIVLIAAQVALGKRLPIILPPTLTGQVTGLLSSSVLHYPDGKPLVRQESGPQGMEQTSRYSQTQRWEALQKSQPSPLNVLNGKLRTRICLRLHVEPRTERVFMGSKTAIFPFLPPYSSAGSSPAQHSSP